MAAPSTEAAMQEESTFGHRRSRSWPGPLYREAADRSTQATPTAKQSKDSTAAFCDPECQPLMLQQEPGPHQQRKHRSSDYIPSYLYRNWTTEKWTPQKARGSAKIHLVAVSAFANIAPVGCMVVSRPHAGVLPSIFLMLVFMCLSLFGASLVSNALTISRCHTLPGLWKEVVGPRTVFVPSVCIAFACFGCAVGYMNFYGHLLSYAFNFKSPLPRLVLCEDIYIIASFVPLSVIVCLKDISVMRFSTYIAGASCLFCLLVVVVRFCDGSYEPYIGRFGFYHEPWTMPQDHLASWRELTDYAGSPAHLVSIQAVLFLFHFNAAKYFRELEYQSKDRYLYAVGAAALVAFIVVGSIMVLVFLQFGASVTPLTFDNYSPADNLVRICRVFFSVGMMGCFPLLFAGMREALVELLCTNIPAKADLFVTVFFQNVFSLILLACVIVVTILGSKADMRLNNIGRCVFGSLLIYVIPPVVFVSAVRKYKDSGLFRDALSWFRMCIMVFMVFIGVGISGLSLGLWLHSNDASRVRVAHSSH